MDKLIPLYGASQVMPDRFMTGILILNFAGNAEPEHEKKKMNMQESA